MGLMWWSQRMFWDWDENIFLNHDCQGPRERFFNFLHEYYCCDPTLGGSTACSFFLGVLTCATCWQNENIWPSQFLHQSHKIHFSWHAHARMWLLLDDISGSSLFMCWPITDAALSSIVPDLITHWKADNFGAEPNRVLSACFVIS